MIKSSQNQSMASQAPRAFPRAPRRRGFTLIELLVVILIILLVSAVALPVVLPAMAHRQISEAARILQGALVGAKDAAMHNGTPSGIRLIPDPAFPLIYITSGANAGQIDPTQPLAYNRIIPIETAPEYTSGMLSLGQTTSVIGSIPYPAINGGGFYPFGVNSVLPGSNVAPPRNVLMVKESVVHNTTLNEPTSWFWNVRVGDKLQINGSGLWYTIVGPMVVPPQGATINGTFIANPEQFVNVGLPGTQSPLTDIQGTGLNTVSPEFLFLVNGLDDNKNGWIDEGYDGVNNNLNQETAPNFFTDDLLEWEFETWPAAILANIPTNVQYTIQRRPAPVQNAREISLPTNVVIDVTTWNNANVAGAFAERSQFPPGVINPNNGYIDILLYPNGTVVPTTLYSAPSSFGMSGAFFHFWLSERADVLPAAAAKAPFLPIGNIKQQLVVATNPYPGPFLQGESRIVTLFTRTGQVTTTESPQFDNPLNPANGTLYNPLYPFLATEQGSKGSR
jgi:prepilin-type N-terminal cleavage/methylation domain-containing protein